MSVYDIAALSFFVMAQAVTFAAGVLVGSVLSRKDASNDSDSDKDPKKDPNWWHTVGGK